MAILLKDMYSIVFYERIGDVFAKTVPTFDKMVFFECIFTPDFQDKELKERMRHTVSVLHNFFPANFQETVNILKMSIGKFRENGIAADGLAYMFIPDYIQVYGIDDYDNSVAALEFITQFVSCEFAVRPFLLKYPEAMLSKMEEWSKHENYKVRRLASEGSRLRLPWGMAVPFLNEKPELILTILENLKNDPSEYVRRSVANSLNDMAKGYPEMLLQIVKKWTGISKETDAVIKHGCRTLLKQGHTEILNHYGLNGEVMVLTDFFLITPLVKMGENLSFNFSITNHSPIAQKVRLEYAIFYRKKSGDLSKKVFKISEKLYLSGCKEDIKRQHKFIVITTRTYYPGAHELSIIVNGQEKNKIAFILN